MPSYIKWKHHFTSLHFKSLHFTAFQIDETRKEKQKSWQGEEELNGGKDEEAPRISIRLGIYLLYVTTHMVKGYNGHIYYKRDVTSNNAPEDMIRSSVPGSKSIILGKAK